MEDANRDYDSHSNTQDDSNDSPLNDTITITDDPTVDNSQEEHEVIYLTISQVSSVLPSCGGDCGGGYLPRVPRDL